MSATTTPTTPPPTPAQAAVNDAIKSAQNLPDLIAKVQTIDPAFADAITGKALIASKSPWGVLAGSLIAWLIAKYGLACTPSMTSGCWSDSTVQLVSGVAAMGGGWLASYAMRLVTQGPITGILKPTPPTTTATLDHISKTVSAQTT
jgi:hypothetical protein